MLWPIKMVDIKKIFKRKGLDFIDRINKKNEFHKIGIEAIRMAINEMNTRLYQDCKVKIGCGTMRQLLPDDFNQDSFNFNFATGKIPKNKFICVYGFYFPKQCKTNYIELRDRDNQNLLRKLWIKNLNGIYFMSDPVVWTQNSTFQIIRDKKEQLHIFGVVVEKRKTTFNDMNT